MPAARDLISGGKQHGGGGSDGQAQIWADGSRHFAARLRLRRGRRADDQGHRGRSGACGQASARARHQLFRHGADVRQRRKRAQSRAGTEIIEAGRLCRHQGATAANRAGQDRRGDRRLARSQPRAAANGLGRFVSVSQRRRRHHRGRQFRLGHRAGGSRARLRVAARPGQVALLRHHRERRDRGAAPRRRCAASIPGRPATIS